MLLLSDDLGWYPSPSPIPKLFTDPRRAASTAAAALLPNDADLKRGAEGLRAGMSAAPPLLQMLELVVVPAATTTTSSAAARSPFVISVSSSSTCSPSSSSAMTMSPDCDQSSNAGGIVAARCRAGKEPVTVFRLRTAPFNPVTPAIFSFFKETALNSSLPRLLIFRLLTVVVLFLLLLLLLLLAATMGEEEEVGEEVGEEEEVCVVVLPSMVLLLGCMTAAPGCPPCCCLSVQTLALALMLSASIV